MSPVHNPAIDTHYLYATALDASETTGSIGDLAERAARGIYAMRDTFYVDADNGNDSNDGKSPERPFLTIHAAHDAASDGDTVFIAEGIYDENANAVGLNITNNDMTFIGAGWRRVELNNSHASATSVLYVDGARNYFYDMSVQDAVPASIDGVVVTASGVFTRIENFYASSFVNGFDIDIDGVELRNVEVMWCTTCIDIAKGPCYLWDVEAAISNTTSLKLSHADADSCFFTDCLFAGSTDDVNIITGCDSNLFIRCWFGNDDIVDADEASLYVDTVYPDNETSATVALTGATAKTLKEWTVRKYPIEVSNCYIDYSAYATAQADDTLDITVEVKVDGTNYRVVDRATVTSEDTDTGFVLAPFMVFQATRIRAVSSAATTDNVVISYIERVPG